MALLEYRFNFYVLLKFYITVYKKFWKNKAFQIAYCKQDYTVAIPYQKRLSGEHLPQTLYSKLLPCKWGLPQGCTMQTSVALFKWLQEVSENMLWRCSGELFAMFWRTFGDVLANFSLSIIWIIARLIYKITNILV